MPPLLIGASTFITLALIFYTAGVFLERSRGTLKPSYVLLFWCGLICDSTGTFLMGRIAADGGQGVSPVHGVTGAIAIGLMAIHAVWALVVCVRRNPGRMETFHRFSTAVWLVWLVPYLTGMLMGIPALGLGPVPAIVTSVIVVAVLAVLLFRGTIRNARQES